MLESATRAKDGTNLETISPSETSKNMGKHGKTMKTERVNTRLVFGFRYTLMTEWEHWHVFYEVIRQKILETLGCVFCQHIRNFQFQPVGLSW